MKPGTQRIWPVIAAFVAALIVPAVAQATARPPLPSPRPAVEIHQCPQDTGWYDQSRNVIVGCGDIGPFGFAHERGHAYDAHHLDAGERARFARLVGRVGDPWEAFDRGKDGIDHHRRDSLNEMFADAYANCRLGRNPAGELRGGAVRGTNDASTTYQPTRRQHRRICGFIARAAD